MLNVRSRETAYSSFMGVGFSDISVLLSLDREERISKFSSFLPIHNLPDPSPADCAATIRGGRRAALRQLSALDPIAYRDSRNYVDGAVSGLSPWIRHGVLSLAEVRDTALAYSPSTQAAEKFITELGWRFYWRKVQASLRHKIRHNIEPPRMKSRQQNAPTSIPNDVLNAETGMDCIDTFVKRLHHTGWLHNHERMWLASWLIHSRGVRWQDGADWFLSHLLDGDLASNHLSWQWIAGTFSSKPYIFNRENLERFTHGQFCSNCHLFGKCDVEGSYDQLTRRLFVGEYSTHPPKHIPPAPRWQTDYNNISSKPLVWITLDSLSATSPAAARSSESLKLFVFDPVWFTTEKPSLKRLTFIFDSLAEIEGIHIMFADTASAILEFAAFHGCKNVLLRSTSCPDTRSITDRLIPHIPVHVIAEEPFCDDSGVTDIRRFSRFWKKVSSSALRTTSQQ